MFRNHIRIKVINWLYFAKIINKLGKYFIDDLIYWDVMEVKNGISFMRRTIGLQYEFNIGIYIYKINMEHLVSKIY